MLDRSRRHMIVYKVEFKSGSIGNYQNQENPLGRRMFRECHVHGETAESNMSRGYSDYSDISDISRLLRSACTSQLNLLNQYPAVLFGNERAYRLTGWSILLEPPSRASMKFLYDLMPSQFMTSPSHMRTKHDVRSISHYFKRYPCGINVQ